MLSEAERNIGEASGLLDTEANVATSCCSAISQEYLVFAKQLAWVFSFTWSNSIYSTLAHPSPTIARNMKDTPWFLTMLLLGYNAVEGSLDVYDMV